MAKYISNRQQNLKIGIVSYTEDKTVLEVTGNVGIKTADTQGYELYVNGDANISGIVSATAFIGNINAGVATITTLSGTNLNYSGIGTIVTLSSTNGTITNLTGTAVTYTTLNATNGRFTGIATASQLYEDNYRVLTAQITEDTKDPIGTPDRAQSIIAFDNSTRTFSISPVSGSFEIWCVGTQHSYTTTQSIVLPNSSGSHYVYFNSVGILTSKQSFFTLSSDAPISYVYWNAGIGTSYLFADERHGVTMDWATHEYLHRTRGASLASGFSISNYSIAGIGSTNTDAQFDLGQGVFFDEDLEVHITHSNTPTADTWEQDLQGPAKIPVFYLDGTEWVLDTSTDYALKQGTTRIRYNLLSGGVWSTPELTTDGYVASWILATNNLNYPVIAIIGQSFDVDSLPIENFNFQDLTLTSFPVEEFRLLYKIIWSSVSTYTNTPKATIHRIDDLRDVTTANPAAYVASNHGLLSGLSADDHLQYLHLDNARTVNAVHTFDVGLISNANILIGSNTSTGITSQRLQVTGGAYVSGNLGIGTNNPTVNLDIIGDGKFSGTITASSFSGTLTGTATSTLHIPNLSGDISSVDTVTTLATVNSAIGTYGGTGSIPVVTVNAKGLVTGVSTVAPNDGTLTLAVSGTGLSGSGTFTANQAGSSSFTVTSNATSNNTNSTIVARDASGNFSAGIITATQLSTGASGIGINTDTISGPAIIIIDPAAVGDNTGAVRIKGDFYVDGTQTWINSTTLEIADYQIGIGTTAPSDLLLDGAGIGIGPVSSRKTFTWDNTNTALKSSENLNLASGKTYKINGTDVLSSNTLGSGIVASSLTSVGTLTILSVGNVYSTGIVTATTFVGSLTNTLTAGSYLTGTSYNNSAAATFAVDATSANTVSKVVARDGAGGFSAGIITATLSGTATTTTHIPNLTGAITSVDTVTSLGSFTSAQLATALTDETGSGSVVFATSPTLVTPVLGAASATSIVVSSGSTFTNGPILVGTGTSTGTASQPLQVTGGAYVSGNLGIGTTNPTSKLTVQGNVLVTGVTTSLTSINTPFYTNPSTITSSYTVPSNQNSFTAGPIGINTGVTVSVSSDSYWKVI